MAPPTSGANRSRAGPAHNSSVAVTVTGESALGLCAGDGLAHGALVFLRAADQHAQVGADRNPGKAAVEEFADGVGVRPDDAAGLAAGRNLRAYLVQTYARDMGNGKMVMMREIDVPIRVKGRHWGGFRTAYRL